MPNILLLGPTSSGKTQLLAKLLKQNFEGSGASTLTSEMHVYDKKNVRDSQIWDTPGSEQNEAIKFGARRVTIILYCVDLSKPFHSNSLTEVREAIKRNCLPDIQVILVGTKAELATNENVEAVEAYAKEQKLRCFITSAKDNIKIDALRDELFPKAEPTPEVTAGTVDGAPRTPPAAVPFPSAQTPAQLFDVEAANLKKNLEPFPAYQKKIKDEIDDLKKVLVDNPASTQEEKEKALKAFHEKSLAILKHRRHPAVKALLAFTAFVFFTFFVAAIGFTIMGLATGIWAPAAFIAALAAAHPGAIAVVSTAAVAGVVGGAAAAHRFFTKAVPQFGQTNALTTFEDQVANDFRISQLDRQQP